MSKQEEEALEQADRDLRAQVSGHIVLPCPPLQLKSETAPGHPSSIVRSGLVHPTVIIAPFCFIENGVRIEANTVIGPYSHLMVGSVVGQGCHIEGSYLEGCVIGQYTNVWRNAHIMRGTRIGKNCLIGHGSFIADGNEIGDRARMMLNVGIGRNTKIGNDVYLGPNVVLANSNPDGDIKQVTVGEGAWIGTNAVTTAGVSIGEHAVIGAGAVVTKYVPPYAVVVGNPAKIIRWNTFDGKEPKNV